MKRSSDDRFGARRTQGESLRPRSSSTEQKIPEKLVPRRRLREVRQEAAESLPSVCFSSRGCYPRRDRRTHRCMNRPVPQGVYVAELFVGSGRVSQAVRKLGFQSREWELEKSEDYDLCRPVVRSHIKSDAKKGLLIAAMLAPPCSSFSIARDRTAVIRTKAEPWGLPADRLSDKDKVKVEIGNKCFRAVRDLLKEFDTRKLPWILENPHSSKCWHLPFLKRLARHKHVQTVIVDFC